MKHTSIILDDTYKRLQYYKPGGTEKHCLVVQSKNTNSVNFGEVQYPIITSQTQNILRPSGNLFELMGEEKKHIFPLVFKNKQGEIEFTFPYLEWHKKSDFKSEEEDINNETWQIKQYHKEIMMVLYNPYLTTMEAYMELHRIQMQINIYDKTSGSRKTGKSRGDAKKHKFNFDRNQWVKDHCLDLVCRECGAYFTHARKYNRAFYILYHDLLPKLREIPDFNELIEYKTVPNEYTKFEPSSIDRTNDQEEDNSYKNDKTQHICRKCNTVTWTQDKSKVNQSKSSNFVVKNCHSSLPLF